MEFNRTRGSLSVPETSATVTANSVIRGVPASESYEDRTYRLTSDYYEKYDQGRWSYKPFRSIKRAYVHCPLEYSDVDLPCAVHDRSQPTWTYSGQRLIDAPALSEWDKLPYYELNEIALGRLGGKIESRLPTLRPDFDLYVFLYEIQEVVQLFDLFKLQVGNLVDKMTGKNLELHFAVFPLAGEMDGICQILAGITHRWKSVADGAMKVHDLAASVTVPEDKTTRVVQPYGSYPWVCDQSLKPLAGYDCPRLYEDTTIAVRYSATVKYRYTMPEFASEIERRLSMILTSIGLAPNWKSKWNTIPFSFVVDWCFNTNRLFSLLRLDKLGLDVSTEIIDCCVVQHAVETKTHFVNNPCYNMRYERDVGSVATQTMINRWVGEEAFNMLQGPWFKLPGFMQMHLGASLLWQLAKR